MANPYSHADLLAYVTARLAQEPTLSANAIQQELREEGAGLRRQTVQDLVRQAKAEHGIAHESRLGRDIFRRKGAGAKREDAAAVLQLARRDYGGQLEPARKAFNTRHPDRAISRAAVKKYAPATIEKRGARYYAKPFDRIPRERTTLTTDGVQTFIIRDSRTANLIYQYNADLQAVMNGAADSSVLKKYQNKSFTVDGKRYYFETDYNQVLQFAQAGELEDLEIGT